MARSEERVSAIRGFPSGTSHRLSALSGAAFVVLLLASFILGLGRPTFDDPASKFASFYNDHESRLQLSLLLAAFSTFALAWFFGFLRWLYEGAERSTRGFVRAAPIAFGAGIAGVALASAGGLAQLTAVELHSTLDPSVIRALDLMDSYGTVWTEVLLSAFLLSSFFIIRVTNILPSWLGIVAVTGTVLGLFQAAVILAPGQDDGVFGIAGLIWFALFLVYILGSSVLLARRVQTALLAG